MFFFGLKLSHLIFSASEQFSTNLQGKDTIQDATHGAELLVSHLKSLRSDYKFTKFYDDVLEESAELTEEPILPRYRKRPRRYDDGSHPHSYEIPKDRYMHFYYEALDMAYGEIERRFHQEDFQLLQKLEHVLIQAANGVILELDDTLLKYLEKDIDLERFSTQLKMVKDMIQIANPVKQVTTLRTIADAMNVSQIYKGMLQEIDKVLKLYFTLPVTTSTAERSFSSLRRLKTFVRSTMTQSRRNNLLLLYIHSTETNHLDMHSIAKEFASVNSRRCHYFGKF